MPASLPQTWLTNAKVPFNKLYAQLCCITYLLNSIEPQNTFTADIKALLAKYPMVDPAQWALLRIGKTSRCGNNVQHPCILRVTTVTYYR